MAQIRIVDAALSLVHIPLSKYQEYLPAILRLLFPSEEDSGPGLRTETPPRWVNSHPFLNVSVTPIEVSIVCTTDLAKTLHTPFAADVKPPSSGKSDVAVVSSDDYIVISVEGGGSESGQRVLELTGPLALAGIPLFLYTTYFQDYILVPQQSRSAVIRALEDHGFIFEKTTDSNINAHRRVASSSFSLNSTISPTTPPPTTIGELQSRTFALLSKRSIVPYVDPDLHLVQCTGRHENPLTAQIDNIGLQFGLTKCLIRQPRFLSLTLTEDESASLVLERRFLKNFDVDKGSSRHDSSTPDNVLIGSKDDIYIPISLDLESLPLDATGIVCGVAGRLVARQDLARPIEMSYLSTARAGTVMVTQDELDEAIRALRIDEVGAIVP